MNADPAGALAEAWELLRSGDARGALRHLRFHGEGLALADVARIVGEVARSAGFDDLVAASTALTRHPKRPQALYDFGYACVERGVSFLAVPALTEALRRVPGSRDVLIELVAALEREHRHAEAARLLEERDATLPPWPERYLLAYNALMAGEPAKAEANFSRLPPPDDDWQPAATRMRRMLDRAAAARAAAPLDRQDLRGWHFTLTGGVLTTLSPLGFDAMTGRYAYTKDDPGRCRHGLHRLRLVLAAADDRPAEELAAEILRADPTPDPGDGMTPADSDDALTRFVAAVAGRWLTGPRDPARSPGPVPSSSFH